MGLLDKIFGDRESGVTATLEATAPARSKSLRDQTAIVGDLGAQTGVAVGVMDITGGVRRNVYKKSNVLTLRRWAEYSVWVRAAIDIYRGSVSRAVPHLGPKDSEEDANQTVVDEVQALLDAPNPAGIPYATLKEMMVEDYLVVGHGCVEFQTNRMAQPVAMFPLDAGRIAFVPDWDGTPDMPRYAELDRNGRVRRYFADAQMMTLVNRPRSYDQLGLSHVELLDLAVRVLLESDSLFLEHAQNPTPGGALNLGPGATAKQVQQVRAEIEAVRKAFVVMGGTEKMGYVNFDGSRQQIKVLDQCEWFVRQVAAIFQVSTAALRLAVDTSRANTEAMFDNDEEGPAALLLRLRDLERSRIVGRWGSVRRHNVDLDYPILNRKDEKKQAEIANIAGAGQAWKTINELRRDTGADEYVGEGAELANELLIETGSGPVPASIYWKQLNEPKPTVPPNTQPPGAGGQPQQGGGGQGQEKDPPPPQESKSADGRWNDREVNELSTFGDDDARRALAYLSSINPRLAELFSAPANKSA